MAALAERQEVRAGIVGGVVVEMGTGKDHAGAGQLCRPSGPVRELREPAAFAIAPGAALLVPPTAVTEMRHELTVRPSAALAAAFGAAEATEAESSRQSKG